MKTTFLKTTTKYASIALVTILGFACQPAEGPQGEQGIQGEKGDKGEKGENGNANVTVKTVEADPGPYLNWTAGTYLGSDANFFEINDTAITQDVSDNSLILVYFQLFGQDIWYPMNYSYTLSDGKDQIITFTHELNKITIYAFKSSGVLNAGISKVKYFIIDSSNSGDALLDPTDYSKLSYNELTSHFNLKS